MLNYFLNNSGPSFFGCCPRIVRGPTGSVIEAFNAYRGNVALIVDFGHCATDVQDFE